MPSLEYFLIAESVSVDRRTNRVSLLNIIDEINSNEYSVDPATGNFAIPQLAAVSSWKTPEKERGEEFHIAIMAHLAGKDTVYFSSETTLTPRGETTGNKHHHLFSG